MTAKLAAEPNVTPMIDVMLVLLIIFMVVAPMLLAGTSAQPPSGTNLQAHPQQPADVTLGIDARGGYTLERESIVESELGRRLRTTYAGCTECALYINADRRLDYSRVLAAIEIARESGVHVVGMIAVQRGEPSR